MIQFITECMTFCSAFSKTKLKFEMWFLLYLLIKFWFQVFLGCKNALRTQEIKWHSKLVSGQFEFLEIWRARSSVAKNSYLTGRFGRDRPMKRRPLINGRDEALFDRNGAIIYCIRPINDQRSGCVHVFKWRGASFSSPPLDIHPTIAMCRWIHRSRVISAVITRELNGWDGLT